MSNFLPNLNQVPFTKPENPDSNPRSRWKRVTLASLLSLVFPGTGQLLNRQPRKGFVLASITYLFTILTAKTRVVFVFPTMVATLFVGIIWKLFVAVEAGYAAGAAKEPESAVPMPRLTYSALALIFVAAAVLAPSADQLKTETGFAAFKIPSASMCPTICLGERIVADMHTYKSKPLERGDLILLKHSSSEGLFVKRVIALAGDKVGPGPDGSIIVNGKRFDPPKPCGTPVFKTSDPFEYSMFQPTTVPEGSLFVVGDNIGNSFDSRIPDFGIATPDMVRGKPLFLYWSPNISRIGCSVH